MPQVADFAQGIGVKGHFCFCYHAVEDEEPDVVSGIQVFTANIAQACDQIFHVLSELNCHVILPECVIEGYLFICTFLSLSNNQCTRDLVVACRKGFGVGTWYDY